MHILTRTLLVCASRGGDSSARVEWFYWGTSNGWSTSVMISQRDYQFNICE